MATAEPRRHLLDAWAPRSGARALAWYVALTMVMTWPLASRLASGVPADFGDPLLNCWILAWNAEHFLAALSGDVAALGTLWHGNIFYPDQYTLGYSELLIAQTLQVLPVYGVTKNVVLCYNLLFLSTFALSGLGMFLLVRALVGDWRAAFVAGLFYAFLPYRLNQVSHLQVMSTQWMPLALYGFHRAIATRRPAPLLGGALALVAQNLSCGYFLVFFSLFVPPFVVFELARHGRLRDIRAWASFAMAGALVAALTLPFMAPYLALRGTLDTRRDVRELETFSADVRGWLTADAELVVWGPWLRASDKPEGALFPGALPVVFAALGLVAGSRRAWRACGGRRSSAAGRVPRALPASLAWLAAMLTLAGLLAAVMVVTGAGGLYQVAGLRLRISSLTRAAGLAAAGIALLVLLSDRARCIARSALRSPLVFAVVCAAIAAYLSLGPNPQVARDELNGPPLYLWLYRFVPGADGLRVPARFGMVAALFLTMAAGWGLRGVLAASGGRRGVVATAASALWLVESAMLPFPVDVPLGAETPGVRPPPPQVAAGREVPAVYRAVQALPEDAVLLEFPFGDVAWEIRHVYSSTVHWRRLINGYSGYIPPRYTELKDLVGSRERVPDAAWAKIADSGATHVVVHGGAYDGTDPPAPYHWLESNGAVKVASVGGDSLYRLPPHHP